MAKTPLRILARGAGVLRHVQGTHAVGQWQGACMGQVTGMCVHMCKLNVTTHTHTLTHTRYTQQELAAWRGKRGV